VAKTNAGITLTNVPWPIGTAVPIYPRTSDQVLPDLPPTGVPIVLSPVVAAGQTLQIAAQTLEDGQYWAAAPVTPGFRDYRWVGVGLTPEPPVQIPGPPGPQGVAGPAGSALSYFITRFGPNVATAAPGSWRQLPLDPAFPGTLDPAGAFIVHADTLSVECGVAGYYSILFRAEFSNAFDDAIAIRASVGTQANNAEGGATSTGRTQGGVASTLSVATVMALIAGQRINTTAMAGQVANARLRELSIVRLGAITV
jgi:hypothetical protein